MSTYVTDLRHYLDDEGEIVADMPREARQLASFLALIVDETSKFDGDSFDELTIRCRAQGCHSQILARLDQSKEIVWHCPTCGHDGVIRNWLGTKWDRSQD